MDLRQLWRQAPWALLLGLVRSQRWLPQKSWTGLWIPQVRQHYLNQLQQQNPNQKCHIISKGDSSHRHIQLSSCHLCQTPERGKQRMCV